MSEPFRMVLRFAPSYSANGFPAPEFLKFLVARLGSGKPVREFSAMGAAIDSEQILPHIPYLRRHARLLTGSRDVGDEYVRICLELIVAEPERLAQDDDPRVALFRAFYAAWAALNKEARPHVGDAISREDRLEQGLAALAPMERRVLLLVVVEDLPLDDVARILDLDLEATRAHLARARTNLKQEVELPVLIIEDEPMIAMELAQIVREMGFSVAGTSARQEDAVMAAGSGKTTDLGLVLADIQLQDKGSGIAAAQAILERYDVPIVFVTGFPERLLTGNGLEPAFVVAKPFDAESLKVTIAHAVATYAKAQEAVEHRARLLAKLRQITASRGIDPAP
jgi:DNA-directed RNA polymerase specialized sigma24 family protein/FixJ family two-component response regulator